MNMALWIMRIFTSLWLEGKLHTVHRKDLSARQIEEGFYGRWHGEILIKDFVYIIRDSASEIILWVRALW